MTNVFGTPNKGKLKRRLFDLAVEALEHDGWKVSRVEGNGKSSVRRITRGRENMLISIRTTQDAHIAFPRDKTDKKWGTLSEVDAVIAVSVDDPDLPRFANVHMIDGDEMRDRFDRTYAARKAAGHQIPLGRGVWLSLYHQEADEPPNRVGAGAGLKHPPIARVPLTDADDSRNKAIQPHDENGEALTISEAKRRLALTFGVTPDSVKIVIEA